MSSLTALTLAEARAGLRAREFSARELAEAYIAAMEAARPLNAFITETPERALLMAAAADERGAILTQQLRPLLQHPVGIGQPQARRERRPPRLSDDYARGASRPCLERVAAEVLPRP